MKQLLFLCFIPFLAAAQGLQKKDLGYLKPEDQKYYKNDSFEGMNKIERIDSAVKEINKIHGEIAALKSELAAVKEEVAALKAKK